MFFELYCCRLLLLIMMKMVQTHSTRTHSQVFTLAVTLFFETFRALFVHSLNLFSFVLLLFQHYSISILYLCVAFDLTLSLVAPFVCVQKDEQNKMHTHPQKKKKKNRKNLAMTKHLMNTKKMRAKMQRNAPKRKDCIDNYTYDCFRLSFDMLFGSSFLHFSVLISFFSCCFLSRSIFYCAIFNTHSRANVP